MFTLETEIIVALIASLTALVVSLVTYSASKNIKKLNRLEDYIDKLKEELCARMTEENVACHWIYELTDMPSTVVKVQLRDKTYESVGLRPSMRPSDVTRK